MESINVFASNALISSNGSLKRTHITSLLLASTEPLTYGMGVLSRPWATDWAFSWLQSSSTSFTPMAMAVPGP